MIETEQPAKPFTGAHLALGLRELVTGWEQQQILLALMIPLVVRVDDVLPKPSCPKTQTNSRPAIPKTCKQALLHTGTATSAGAPSTRPGSAGYGPVVSENTNGARKLES